MKDLKKIQEFFSKPLEEAELKLGVKYELPNGDTGYIMTQSSDDPKDWIFSDGFKKVPYFSVKKELKPLATQPGKYDGAFDLGLGKGHHIDERMDDEDFDSLEDAIANREFGMDYNQLGPNEKEWVRDEMSMNEMDINDPVLMKMRAAKDKLAKMRAANAGDDGNDKFFDNAKKIAFLKKEREQLMRDMEQEAEPEGGPIADEYGSKLNRIDKAIAKLSGRKEMTYDQAIAQGEWGPETNPYMSKDEIERRAAMIKEMTYDQAIAEGFKDYLGYSSTEISRPTQNQVDRFFTLTQNETHYLNSKPVEGQEKTFNKMEVEPWDEYDLSNWNALVKKARQRGKSIDEATGSKVEVVLSNQILDFLQQRNLITGVNAQKVHKDLTAFIKNIKINTNANLNENNSYARVSMPSYVKDKKFPNFLYVNIEYDLGPGGSSIALGKETMSGQIRRESAAEAMRLAGDVARDLEAEYNLEDIDIVDKENGVVQVFAVSDDFINMDPNMLGESLNENLNPEVSNAVNRFIKAMAKRYDYSEQDAVYAIMAALKQRKFDGLNESQEEDEEVDYSNISSLEDELRRLRRWSSQYGSKGADSKIEYLEQRIEYLKSNPLNEDESDVYRWVNNLKYWYDKSLNAPDVRNTPGGQELFKSEVKKWVSTLNEAKEEDKIDIVTMDVPLFIRALEYAKEDAQEDMDLHDFAEKAIAATKEQGILQMDDYDMLIGSKEPMNELTVAEKVIAQLKEAKPGLWANINAKQKRGEKPSHGNSDAFKSAVKAGKEINKKK